MKLRIAIWTAMGALVVLLWTAYLSATSHPLEIMWGLLDLTCPIALARRHAMSIDFVLLMNAATYALVGTVVETLRHHRQPSQISH